MVLRVAIVGAQVPRVAKVLSIVNKKNGVEYLPLVASFGSYEDEEGKVVKYLSNVSYHGTDGRQQKGSSLAPFFDEEPDDEDTGGGPVIDVLAIGCGIEDEADIEQIRNFLAVLAGSLDDVTIECITPNLEYATMKDETMAYRSLDSDEKQRATELQTIGPGKMAQFVDRLCLELLERRRPQPPVPDEEYVVGKGEDGSLEERIIIDAEEPETPVTATAEPHFVDPKSNRYACRICRHIIFGEADLQDPPHLQAKHRFRKLQAAGNNCESLFLATSLDWMGDTSPFEGRVVCPFCSAKVGSWNWSGAQCSCGTWVTPAIQVPRSKIDLVKPAESSLCS